MKLRSKILIGAGICLIAPALFFAAHGVSKRHEVERTRRQLRAEGFKIDLSEFENSFTPASLACGEIVIHADIVGEVMERDIRVPVYQAANMFRMHTSNSVVVPWQEEFYAGARKRSPWPAVRQTLEKRRPDLDAAIAALMAGPIAFREEKALSDEQRSWAEKLPSAAETISVDLMCRLHFGERREAWTNLLALTRVVTSLQFEPIHYRQRTALQLMPKVYFATWYALQDHTWSDQQLAALEAEWAHVDFFAEIPTSIARQRASIGPDFERFRHPKEESDWTLSTLIKEWKMIPFIAKETSRRVWYRWDASYDDERKILLFLRDREINLRRAAQAPTAIAMRALAPDQNDLHYVSPREPNYPSSINVEMEFFASRLDKLVGSLGYAADAEIRRRIIRTAIALERFKLRKLAYPQNLNELTNAPSQILIDFADGNPLRYRKTDDGSFLLYSIGLDGLDNHGDGLGGSTNGFVRRLQAGIPRNTDVVWPLPAHFPRVKAQAPEE
jgi:hypothetical protein